MTDFLKNNWLQLVEILVSLILGFIGGMKYQNMKNKNVANVKGNNNNINQGGNVTYENRK